MTDIENALLDQITKPISRMKINNNKKKRIKAKTPLTMLIDLNGSGNIDREMGIVCLNSI